jgi:hypothetical protein
VSGDERRLLAVKIVHTVVWAFFAGCILAIPVVAWRGDVGTAGVLCGIVLIEVLVVIVSGWRCPLTPIAARYTTDRRDNFDIFLPEWLARHNKSIFGTLYAVGLIVVMVRWLG